MIQNHPTTNGTTPAEPKSKHHHRGRRGSRRRTSSASQQDDSPALQSIQDLIAEMRRLPHLDDDSADRNNHLKIHDWPSQRSRRHSEPPLGLSSNTTTAIQQESPSPSHPLAVGPTTTASSTISWSAIAAQNPEKALVGIHGASSSTSSAAATGHLAVPFPKRGRSRSLPHITVPAPHNGQQAPTTARRQLYATHLPVPDAMHLVEQHELYAGTLAVDWKDSSDAYVVCEELGRIYIYGSRNRNRALHGDMVAVELVDVETMMAEKAAKKQARRRSSVMLSTSLHSIPENAPSPTYCGRVVSILERPKRMLFSGTLAIDRPSSTQQQQQEQQHDKRKGPPKIIWFVPADKRLPLVAVPVKHAPSGFLKHHEEFKNRIFTGSVQRWPVTSLHPFGSIEREIGWMGELPVHSKALMSDHHLKDIDFTPAVLQESSTCPNHATTSAGSPHEKEHGRLDLRSLHAFTLESDDHAFSIKPLDNGLFEVGVHAVDVASMIRPNTITDREARERAVAVRLVERTVPMLPEAFDLEHARLIPGKERPALSVLCHVTKNGSLMHTWIGKTVIQASEGMNDIDYQDQLLDICQSLQTRRIQEDGGLCLARSYQKFDIMSDNGYPCQVTRVHEHKHDTNVLLRELMVLAGQQVAQKILSRFSEEALLCHQLESTACSSSSQQDLVRDYLEMDTGSFTELIKAAEQVVDQNKRDALLHMLQPNPEKYFCSGTLDISQYRHGAYAVPLYTVFAQPLDKYACLVVQRQLHAALKGEGPCEKQHPVEKVARHCNSKEAAERDAEQASKALYTSAFVYRECLEGRPVIQQAVVIGIQHHVLTLYIPDYDLQKDVHLLNHPGILHTTFYSADHSMELTWEGDEISQAEEEEPPSSSSLAAAAAAAADDHNSDLVLTVDDEEHGLRHTSTSIVEFMSCIDIRITSDMKVVRPCLDIQLVNPLFQ
ncbi:rnb-domain-containing protein [Lichtheimia corymbifera JMRC:FSU:9682]|uniref:Rnb-domain-containing protein n=1 Tax=Lichtheimia corymbifera JMRC:FSU:9682 TaxID=1263082 RepID=A0A068SE35_9FUNG|nr:rnb-domain-containing protein [Lichtheimia corymbifera JMRC:FSU:9682]CDH61306.1 rnb-domain-containing protein [Lichtheimia corymbifera JMRC:FSU:9682]